MTRQHSSHLAPQDEPSVPLANAVTEVRRRSVLTTRSAPLAGARGLLCFAHSHLGTPEAAAC